MVRKAFALFLLLGGILLWCPSALPADEADDEGDEDTAVVEDLRRQGIDLSQPQEIVFAFSFPKREGARRTWRLLAREGFRGRIEDGAAGEDFLLLMHKRVLVDEKSMHALREQLDKVA